MTNLKNSILNLGVSVKGMEFIGFLGFQISTILELKIRFSVVSNNVLVDALLAAFGRNI